MGTCTAQIMVGQSHTYDGGIINISHVLMLAENSVAKWTLSPANMFGENEAKSKPVTWIPTIEHMLEDAFLMIGIYVLKNKKLIELCNPYITKEDGFVPLYEKVPAEVLEKMYEVVKEMDWPFKLVISGFFGSTILRQLPVVKQYPFEVEVCIPTYSREKSAWTNTNVVRVSIDLA